MTIAEFRDYLFGQVDCGEISPCTCTTINEMIFKLLSVTIEDERERCASIVLQTPLVVGKRHIYAQEAITRAAQRLLDGVQPEANK